MEGNDNKLKLDDEKIAELTKKISSAPQNQGENIPSKTQASDAPQEPASNEEVAVVSTQIKSLRTFQGDVADIIKQKNSSVLSIALAEKKKQQEVKKTTPPRDPEFKKNILIALASFLLIILGSGAIFFFYSAAKKAPVKNTEVYTKTIIPYDKRAELNITPLDKKGFIQSIATAKNQDLSKGEFLYIEMKKAAGEQTITATIQDVLFLLNASVPGSALRAFSGNFMLGYYKETESEPFMLIELASFENAYDGMLRWENSIYSDLSGIFNASITKAEPDQIAPTTSTTTTANPFMNSNLSQNPKILGFADETIRNKDTRVLKDSLGNILLIYSFLDKKTLLITRSYTVLQETINKINAEKLIR